MNESKCSIGKCVSDENKFLNNYIGQNATHLSRRLILHLCDHNSIRKDLFKTKRNILYENTDVIQASSCKKKKRKKEI